MPQDAKIRLDRSKIRSLNFKVKEGESKSPVSITYDLYLWLRI